MRFSSPTLFVTIAFITLSGLVFFALGCTTPQNDLNDTTVSMKANQDQVALFELQSPDSSGFYFYNELQENEDLNILTYEYLYNGSGVAIGDINKDGLPDVFMGGNLFGGRLFLNKGNLKFEQISESAGVFVEGYTTGITMVDINNDGYDDIYLCRSLSENPAYRKNVLLVNNQDLTFTDRAAEYGLDDPSFSTQANFFDYDQDGDLDMYLLNHRIDFDEALTLRNYIGKNKKSRKDYDKSLQYISDKLYRNNGNQTFTDVTQKAGLVNRAFGLGVAVADINKDGYQDIYVANDYADKDHLYLNNGNGTFSDQIDHAFSHLSKNSMGCELADINNDGWLDIMNLDMIAEDNYRQKQLKGQSPYDLYHLAVKHGLSHQVMRNTLQLNNGDGTFSEIAQLAGVSHTDWSWTPIFADFDNDGYKDLFISNGYYRDVTDMDYIKYESNTAAKEARIQSSIMAMVNKIKSNPQVNYIFKNNGDLTFSNQSSAWGFAEPSFSNGCAFADLDLDGDLDLITNNLNKEAFLFKNRADEIKQNNFISFRLKGALSNPNAIGAKVTIKAKGHLQFQDFSPYKGYLSNHHKMVHFGLGIIDQVDSLIIDWGNGIEKLYLHLAVNKIHVISEQDGQVLEQSKNKPKPILKIVDAGDLSNYQHRENPFIDFKKEPLLEHKNSNKGPFLAQSDINNDGFEDVYLGGSKGHAGQLFLQGPEGSFSLKRIPAFEQDAQHEDAQSVFFDADGDGDADLYVISGGYEFQKASTWYFDRLYLNDGKANFTKAIEQLPPIKENGTCVLPFDLDEDEDLDLMVFGGVSPGEYPQCARSYILRNEKGVFLYEDSILPNKGFLGIVNDATIASIDQNQVDQEIILAREWDGIQILKKTENGFKDISASCGLATTSGWWNCLVSIDLDQDGDLDIIAGNRGENSFYKANEKYPAQIIFKDFDNNGSIDALPFYYFNDHQLHPKHTFDEVFTQLPHLKKKFTRYEKYSSASLTDIFTKEELKDAQVKEVHTFQSSIFFNDGHGNFTRKTLPNIAQFSEVQGILCTDINNDNRLDLILTGNNYGVDLEMGISDANTGCILLGSPSQNTMDHFTYPNKSQRDWRLRGDTRGIYEVEGKTRSQIIILKNNEPPVVIAKERKKSRSISLNTQ